MIDVKLSIEEYNRLYMFVITNEHNNFFYKMENENLFCKIKNDHIIFVYDPESDYAIASVSLNTPEGRILSNYIECQLRVSVNENGDISMYETCMNPDDQYIGHCYNCNVDYCKCSYSCEKGMKQKIDGLEKNISDLRFIDPISNRNYELVEKLKEWQFLIENMHTKLSDKEDDDTNKICETVQLLQSQIHTLYEKWKYTEDSANGNG